MKTNNCSYGEIKTTQEYFNMTIDELLVDRGYGYTREECKLFDDGLKVVFYDNIKELEEDKTELTEWMQNATSTYRMEVQRVLLTINERLAVVIAW